MVARGFPARSNNPCQSDGRKVKTVGKWHVPSLNKVRPLQSRERIENAALDHELDIYRVLAAALLVAYLCTRVPALVIWCHGILGSTPETAALAVGHELLDIHEYRISPLPATTLVRYFEMFIMIRQRLDLYLDLFFRFLVGLHYDGEEEVDEDEEDQDEEEPEPQESQPADPRLEVHLGGLILPMGILLARRDGRSQGWGGRTG